MTEVIKVPVPPTPTCPTFPVADYVGAKLNQKHQEMWEHIRDIQKKKEIFGCSIPDPRILFWHLTELLILSYISFFFEIS